MSSEVFDLDAARADLREMDLGDGAAGAALAEKLIAEVDRLNAANANLIRNVEVLADEVVHAHVGVDLTGLPAEQALRLGAVTGEAILAAEARGYARAVAALRDDERFRRWWAAEIEVNEEVALWCGPPNRGHLARYLEVIATEGGEPA
jgi:hypothetical protein